MALIIPQNGFGSRLGTAVGTGLGQGLQDLAQMQLQQMQQRRQMQQQQSQQQQQRELVSQGLGALFPQEKAQSLAGLPPDLLKEVLKQQLPQLGEVQVGSALESIISGGQQAPQQVAQQQAPLQELLAPQEQLPQQLPVQPEAGQPVAEAPLPVPVKKLSPGAKASQELERLEVALARPGLTASQKEKVRDRAEKRHQNLRKEQDQIDKSTEKFFSEVKKKSQGAGEGDMRLDKMEELIKTGQLPGPGLASFVETVSKGIKGYGIELGGALFSPEGQEFRKLSKDFLRNVKDFFGPRVTQNEVMQFLQTIPTLVISDEGKLRVSRNMRIFNKMAHLKNDVMSQIIEENNGYRPHNLEQLVEKRAKSQVDALAKEFKSDMKTSRAIARRKKLEADPNIPPHFATAPGFALNRIGFKA